MTWLAPGTAGRAILPADQMTDSRRNSSHTDADGVFGRDTGVEALSRPARAASRGSGPPGRVHRLPKATGAIYSTKGFEGWLRWLALQALGLLVTRRSRIPPPSRAVARANIPQRADNEPGLAHGKVSAPAWPAMA